LFDRRVKKKAGWLGTSQWALGSNSALIWHLSFCHLDQAMVQTKKGPSVDKAWHVEKLITQ
jgi:hypothetical protein